MARSRDATLPAVDVQQSGETEKVSNSIRNMIAAMALGMALGGMPGAATAQSGTVGEPSLSGEAVEALETLRTQLDSLGASLDALQADLKAKSDEAAALSTRLTDQAAALSGLADTVRAALPDANPVSLRQHEVALRRAIQQVYPS